MKSNNPYEDLGIEPINNNDKAGTIGRDSDVEGLLINFNNITPIKGIHRDSNVY